MSKFHKMFVLFIVGSVFGCYYEMILNFITRLISDGTFFWERRSGVIYGPFSVIYGLGAVLMAMVFGEKNYKWWQLLIYGGLLGGVCEYFVGWVQNTFTGTTSWDYSNHFLNFGGRTSLFIMLVWGVICALFIKFLYPRVMRWIEKIPTEKGKIVLNILVVLLAVDILISFSAVVRSYLRREDVQALTPYGEFLDTKYPDEKVFEAYPNMVVNDE